MSHRNQLIPSMRFPEQAKSDRCTTENKVSCLEMNSAIAARTQDRSVFARASRSFDNQHSSTLPPISMMRTTYQSDFKKLTRPKADWPFSSKRIKNPHLVYY